LNFATHDDDPGCTACLRAEGSSSLVNEPPVAGRVPAESGSAGHERVNRRTDRYTVTWSTSIPTPALHASPSKAHVILPSANATDPQGSMNVEQTE
jgi:hypothetical protein